MKSLYRKILSLLCVLALVVPVFGTPRPAMASGNYFEDTSSGFVAELTTPVTVTSTEFDVRFKLFWYDPADEDIEDIDFDDDDDLVRSSEVDVYYQVNGQDEEISASSNEWKINDFKINQTSSGPVSITIKVIDEYGNYGSDGTIIITLNYKSIDVPGAKFTADISGGQINAFDGKISLQFPTGTFILDKEEASTVADDQSVEIEVGEKPVADFSSNLVFLSNRFILNNPDSTELSQSGTLTLKYENSIPSEVARHSISIMKKNGWYWMPVGGTVNTANGTVTAPLHELGEYAVAINHRTFGSEFSAGWASPYVLALSNKGMLKEDPAPFMGTPTSRQMFTVMLARGLGLKPIEYPYYGYFADPISNSTDKYEDADYLMAAVTNGLLQGIGVENGRVRLGLQDSLTREQAAVFVTRALKMNVDAYSNNLPAMKKQLAKTYKKDWHQISDWAVPHVYAVTQAKIMLGRDTGDFDPKGNLKFEEACALAYRVMDKLNKFGK